MTTTTLIVKAVAASAVMTCSPTTYSDGSSLSVCLNADKRNSAPIYFATCKSNKVCKANAELKARHKLPVDKE